MTNISIDHTLADETVRSAAEALYSDAQRHLDALTEQTCRGSEWTGWIRYPSAYGDAVLQDIEQYVETLDISYDTIVVCGIGGSYLGARAVSEMLGHAFPETQQRPRIVYAGHHISGSDLDDLLEYLDARKPLINVISKSGTTTETGVAFRVLRQYLVERYDSAEVKKRIVVTTDAKQGALRALAEQEGFRSFELPADIGGRYSVFTPVGLLPLMLAGYDGRSLIEGAKQCFAGLEESSASRPHAALQYAAWRTAAYGLGKKVEVLSYPEPKFAMFAEWWKQLFGESEGKDGRGLLPVSLAMTTDLHSLGQFVQSGDRCLIETFLQVNQNGSKRTVPPASGIQDQLDYLEGRSFDDINDVARNATRLAHSDGGVPNLSLRLEEVNEFSIGSLMGFFMIACAVGGALLDVNPFDQPGVEDYKRNMFALLQKPGFEHHTESLSARLKAMNENSVDQ